MELEKIASTIYNSENAAERQAADASFQRLQAAMGPTQGNSDWAFFKAYLNVTSNPFAQVLLFSRLKLSLVQKFQSFKSTELVDLRMPLSITR